MDDDDIDIKLNIQLFDFASKSFKAELSFKIEDDYFCITNKNEITTIRDGFHNNYIKIDNYKKIIEYSPVEPKSYIVKNLLNEFNFSSYGMNSDDSRFLNLYKIPK